MRKLVFSIMVVGLMTSCAKYNRYHITKFIPTGETGFAYQSEAYTENDEESEQIRIGWLETYLSEHAMCKDGYEITRRERVKQETPLGDFYNIYYTGECL